jgi:hypothetical protein
MPRHGYKQSSEHRAAISGAKTGQPLPEQTRAKISATQRERSLLATMAQAEIVLRDRREE